MRKMKDSGLQWIGNIPEEWTVGRVKDVISLLTDYTANGSFGDLAKNVQYLDDGYARLVRLTDLRENLTNANGIFIDEPTFNYLAKSKLKSGDILVANVGAYSGLFCEMPKVEYPCSLAPNMFLIRTNKRMIQHFLFYVGSSNFVWEQLVQKAVSSAQPKLNKTDIKTTFLPIPPLDEQKKIVDFLDEKCGEIDSIRSDIQKQIDILNDYKKSVITEAVTKGLNPKAKLKDSGIEWIGEIPEHWGVDKLKFHLKFRGTKNPGDTIVLSLYRELGVVPKDSRDDNHNKTSEDTSNYRFVRNGDFVINKMKAWQGSVAVSDYEGIVSPAYYVYGFSDDLIFKRYFHYLLRDKSYATEFKRLSGGIRVGQWDLPRESLENTLILLPPISEQKNIAAYLDEKCSEIDATIADKQKQLETLDEYKKSLIFEYVTGKKEVS